MKVENGIKYNTQQGRLPLPEYGRSVQNMVNHALTLENREERQRCANTIVSIMAGMFPNLKDVEDFQRKLWDHLAIMSDFKLDIDYPVEIIKKENLAVRPERIPYSQNNIRYKHYGRFVEDMIRVASDMEEGDKRNALINMIVNDMKKVYVAWNKEGVENQKIIDDLNELSGGRLEVKLEDVRFVETKPMPQKKKNNNNNHKRKY